MHPQYRKHEWVEIPCYISNFHVAFFDFRLLLNLLGNMIFRLLYKWRQNKAVSDRAVWRGSLAAFSVAWKIIVERSVQKSCESEIITTAGSDAWMNDVVMTSVFFSPESRDVNLTSPLFRHKRNSARNPRATKPAWGTARPAGAIPAGAVSHTGTSREKP